MIRKSAWLLTLGLFFAHPAFAEKFIVPADWNDLGTVSEWMRMDSHFHRITGTAGSTDLKVYDFDQRSVYAQTQERRTGFARIDLEQFLKLPPEAREVRVRKARKELQYVREFRSRIRSYVLRIQENQSPGWGFSPTDHRAIGDVLGRLQEAVILDPSHAYAWHLLAYLSANCGDLWRALEALDGLDAALELLPADALPGIRSRAVLDRAWILRDLGFFEESLQAARKITSGDDLVREALLLRGLLAARAGDFRLTQQIAHELDSTPVACFPNSWFAGGAHAASELNAAIYDPLAWPTRNSSYLKAWILATFWLYEGESDLAWKVFPEFSLDRHYINGKRFLEEAASIYEATGRPSLAARFWSSAHQYVPYTPYLVYRTYGIDLEPFTGRKGGHAIVLGYDTHLISGSRLAYGALLIWRASEADTEAQRIEWAQRAVLELEICRRIGREPVATELILGYAYALLGDSDQMNRAADAALAALAPAELNSARHEKIIQLREIASRDPRSTLRALHPLEIRSETPDQTEARLRSIHAENPHDRAAQRELARFLIRHGHTNEGGTLIDELIGPGSAPSADDWLVALELDRQHNESTRARIMLQALLEGRAGRWPNPDLWATVGILCQEHGVPQAREALEYALELNPGNRGLREYLSTAR